MPWSRRKICYSNLILNIIIREKKKLNKAEDLIRIYESLFFFQKKLKKNNGLNEN